MSDTRGRARGPFLRTLAAVAGCIAWQGLAGAAPAATIEDFARLPVARHVALSPDGTRFAAVVQVKGEAVLVTRRLQGGEPRALLKTDNGKYNFNWVRWVNDQRLVVSVRTPGDARVVSRDTRMLSIPADGGEAVNLVQSRPEDAWRGLPQFQDRVIDWMPEDGHHVLAQVALEGGVQPAVFRIDVDNGRRQMVVAPRRHVMHWLADRQQRVRVAVWQRDDDLQVQARDTEEGDWRTLWSFKLHSRETVTPLGFGRDPNLLYVQADHQGRQAVFSADLREPAPKLKLVQAKPGADLGGGLQWSPASGEAAGVGSTYWDPELQALDKAVDGALPQRHNRLLQFSRDGSRYLVYSSGNGVPPEYYVGNRKTGDLELLAESYRQLDPATLAGKQARVITARDGTRLDAFLSLPKGASTTSAASAASAAPAASAPSAPAQQRLPLVLLPHGGPMSSDDLDFDYETELLASRGYAVLQVNFRGSWGAGRDFAEAGFRQWGLQMQDDLTDAVHWAVAQGIADPARVCIVGSSYGGYAALMGAVKTPDLYRCAASFGGVSDLVQMARSAGYYVNGEADFNKRIGDLDEGRKQLEATSPRRQARAIRIPILLAHGTDDDIVPFSQTEDMAEALEDAGKPHRFVELKGADHHLSRESDRVAYYRALDAFLAQHLAPR